MPSLMLSLKLRLPCSGSAPVVLESMPHSRYNFAGARMELELSQPATASLSRIDSYTDVFYNWARCRVN